MNRKITTGAILFIMTTLHMYAQDSTMVSSPGFMKEYWQSLIHGNVDRTHEKPFDLSFAAAPSYSREGGFGFGEAF